MLWTSAQRQLKCECRTIVLVVVQGNIWGDTAAGL